MALGRKAVGKTENFEFEVIGLRGRRPDQVDYWVKIPLSEELLYDLWKQKEQPSFDDLTDRIKTCFYEWLEGKNGRRGSLDKSNEELPQ